jgi:hypothetical protein
VLVEKVEQVFAADGSHLHTVQGFGRDLVAAAGDGSAEPQHLTRASHSNRHAAATFGANREPDTAFAQQENATSRLPFPKQNGSFRADLDGFDPVEGFESIGLQIAKDPIRALYAIETAVRHGSLSLSVDN